MEDENSDNNAIEDSGGNAAEPSTTNAFAVYALTNGGFDECKVNVS